MIMKTQLQNSKTMDAHCIYCGAKAKDKANNPVCETCKKIWEDYLKQANVGKGGILKMSSKEIFNMLLEGDKEVGITHNADGTRNDYFHDRDYGKHRGVDLNYRGLGQGGDNLKHPDVFSPVSWKDTYGDGQGEYGTIKIKDEDGFSHELLHLESRAVRAGEVINKGDKIGTMGGRGPTGSDQYAQHIHYQIRNQNNEKVNPEEFFLEVKI